MARFTDSRNNYRLQGIDTPIRDTDAANKQYVDNHMGARTIVAGNGISSSVTNDSDTLSVVSRDNFGLTTYDQGVGLSSAFIDAASVLALQTSYEFPSSQGALLTNIVNNVPGTFAMSTSLSTNPSFPSVTAPDSWKSVKSVFIATQDNSTPGRSIEGLAAYFAPGSILEIRRNDENYGVYHISTFDASWTNGGLTRLQILDSELTEISDTDSYNQRKFAGLIYSKGTPQQSLGADYTVILHGRGRAYEGRLMTDSTLRPRKLWTNNEAAPAVGEFLQAGDSDSFHWSSLAPSNITNVIGTIDSWIDDTENFVRTTSVPDEAGEIRMESFNTITNMFSDTLSPGLIRRLTVYPRSGVQSSFLPDMVEGSAVRLVQGTTEAVYILDTDITVSSGAYTMLFTSAGLQYSAGTFNSSDRIQFEFRTSVINPVLNQDIVPRAVDSESIGGNQIGPFHLRDPGTGPLVAATGRVPVVGSSPNSDTGGWEFRQKEPYGAADAVRDELDKFKQVVYDGIGAIPVFEDSDVRRPREFTSINFERNNANQISAVTFGTLPQDTDNWSALDDFFDDQITYAGADVTIHMQVSYQNAATDTELTEIDFFINTVDPSTNRGGTGILQYDSDANTARFVIDTDNSSSVIALDDTHGNASAIPASDVTGQNGYWRNIHMFDGVGEYADLTSQFREIGDPIYNYLDRYNTVIPVILDNDDQRTPNIRMAGLGTGLSYDTDTNQVNAVAGTSGIIVSSSESDEHPGTQQIEFPGATIVAGNDTNEEIVHLQIFAGLHTSIFVYYPGQLVRNASGNLYACILQTPVGTLLTNTTYWVPVGGSSSSVFNDSDNGLVPAPNLEGDSDSDTHAHQYTLRADGNWAAIPNTSGIFTAHTAGLVPPPGDTDLLDYFLAADGKWRHNSEIVVDTDIILALDSLDSSWDSDNNTLILGDTIHIPAVPNSPDSEGSFAEYVVTFAQGAGVTIPLHDGSMMRFTVPKNNTSTFRNYDSETDYVDVAMTNPNISGFAYPPQNALGLRDVMYALMDPDNYPDGKSPWEEFIELNKDASDAVRNNNQLVIGVSTLVDSGMRTGAVDSEDFVRSTFVYNGHTEDDWSVSARVYTDTNTNVKQRGHWPTEGSGGRAAKDSEIRILEQRVPVFSQDTDGLVVGPTSTENTATHFLAGDGSWQPLPADETGITIQGTSNSGSSSHSDVTNIDFRDARIVTQGLSPNVTYRVYDVFRGRYTFEEEYDSEEVVWDTDANGYQNLYVCTNNISSAPRQRNDRDWALIGVGHTFDTETNGLVPNPGTDDADSEHYLTGHGTWRQLPASGIEHVEFSGLLPTGTNAANVNVTGMEVRVPNGSRGATASGTTATINIGLTYTDILNGPRAGPSRFLGSGTLTDGTAWVRYSLDFIGGSTDQNPFVIFYNENASGDPTTFDVYADTGSNPTTQPLTGRIARRTFSGSGDSVTWSDGA